LGILLAVLDSAHLHQCNGVVGNGEGSPHARTNFAVHLRIEIVAEEGCGEFQLLLANFSLPQTIIPRWRSDMPLDCSIDDQDVNYGGFYKRRFDTMPYASQATCCPCDTNAERTQQTSATHNEKEGEDDFE
jgi:hypothetical protein